MYRYFQQLADLMLCLFECFDYSFAVRIVSIDILKECCIILHAFNSVHQVAEGNGIDIGTLITSFRNHLRYIMRKKKCLGQALIVILRTGFKDY